MATAVHSPIAKTSPASRRTGGAAPFRGSAGGGSRGGSAHPALLVGLGDAAGRIDVMRQVNATAGNAAAARLALAARPAVQREDTTGGNEEDGAFVPPERPPSSCRTAASRRTSAWPTSPTVASPCARATRRRSSRRSRPRCSTPATRCCATRTTGASATRPARRSRSSGWTTASAPRAAWTARRCRPWTWQRQYPAQQEEHYLDYARLFADGRLDVTLAIGYDETQTHFDDLDSARAWMTAQKLTKDAPPAPEPKPPAPGEPDIITGADSKPPDANESTRKGLSVPETWKGNRSVTYPDATGNRVTKDIAVSITLVPPGHGRQERVRQGPQRQRGHAVLGPCEARHRPRLRQGQVALRELHHRRGLGAPQGRARPGGGRCGREPLRHRQEERPRGDAGELGPREVPGLDVQRVHLHRLLRRAARRPAAREDGHPQPGPVRDQPGGADRRRAGAGLRQPRGDPQRRDDGADRPQHADGEPGGDAGRARQEGLRREGQGPRSWPATRRTCSSGRARATTRSRRPDPCPAATAAPCGCSARVKRITVRRRRAPRRRTPTRPVANKASPARGRAPAEGGRTRRPGGPGPPRPRHTS